MLYICEIICTRKRNYILTPCIPLSPRDRLTPSSRAAIFRSPMFFSFSRYRLSWKRGAARSLITAYFRAIYVIEMRCKLRVIRFPTSREDHLFLLIIS